MDTTCFRCKEGCENFNHVLIECSVSLKIWEDICKGIIKTGHFNLEWCDWMLHNLRCNAMVIGRFPPYLLFAVTMWFIWKWRCKSVFDTNFKLLVCTGKIITNFVDEWLKANSDSESKNEVTFFLIARSSPETEWAKLNVDENLNLEPGTISARGVIRNHKKKWIGGFALNRGIGSIIEAEL
ncbi:hypothetical protein Dsin_030439 [Dipteronia sinensis]|uniref:Reverse transcriptase zinc-binding domain-containing protein n=1 Tax=Dipteronia sinensis TaxID=43782 RepID=A0AAE0DR41_9ROSI|nr:hypothetical protein Dsin_030439 [Dipteronia sinensis]